MSNRGQRVQFGFGTGDNDLAQNNLAYFRAVETTGL